MEIASLFAKVGADVGDFNKAMGNVRDDLTGGEKSVNKFADVAGAAFKVVAAAALALGVAIATTVGSSVVAAADMEQGIADIGAMMALTSDETAKLQEHIMDLGLDPTLKVSATEASEAVMALGTAGLSMTQIMGGASEATVLLANATGGQFGDAANIATDVMAQFNIKASDMNHAVNLIAGTTVASKFGIDDMRLAIGQAGGVAGSVGITFEDFTADIAATASSFNSGSDAATSYKTFVQRLVPTTAEATSKMIELGLATADGTSKFFDATGAIKSSEERAALLSTAFGGLSDAQRISAASTIFGTDAMRTALSLADGGTPIITKMKKEIGKVDAEELAAKRMDTLKGSWEIFQGVVETLQLKLGQQFLPVARQVVEWTTELAQKYGPKLITWVEDLMKKQGPLISDMTNWAKNVLPPLWQNIKNVTESISLMIKPITDNISKFVSWKDVLTALGILLAGTVLTAIGSTIVALAGFLAPIAAVIAAVAAMRFAWEQDFMGIRTFVLSSLQKMSDWFFQESGIWKGTWEDTLEYLKWWANVGWKNEFYFPIRSWLYEVRSEITTWAIWTQNGFEAWVQRVKDTFAGWKNDAIQLFTIWKDRVVSTFEDFFGPKYKVVADWAARTVSQLNTWVQHWKDKLTPWYTWIVEKFQGLFDWWDEHIQPWIDTGRQIVQGLWDGIKDKWDSFTSWWKGVWTGTVDWVKNLLGIRSPSTVFESIGADLMAGLTNGIDAAKQGPLNAIESLTTQVKTKMDGMIDKVANSAQTIRDQINNMPALPEGYWSTPAGPTTPTTPVVTTPVVAPPMTGDTPVVQHGGVDFGAKLLSNGLNMIASFVDTSGFMSDVAEFANTAKTLLTTNGQTLASSSAEAQAIRDLSGPGLDSRRVNDLLNMMQSLVSKLDERGLGGTQLNLSLAPDAALAQQTELEALVAYLNALNSD